MGIEIFWRVFVKTKDKKKVDLILKQIRPHIALSKIITNEVYWKDDSIYNLEFTSELLEKEKDSSILEVIRLISVISDEWDIVLPDMECEDILEFSGIGSKTFKIPLISWCSFAIQEKE